jgi:type IV pilus assembly protein PilM
VARRLIGLDVGTNAVTLAEVTPGSPPRLERFGQVALPRDAMREGEVADDLAVTEAVARLRDEIGLRRQPVRIGVASPRLIVRQIEMPVMGREELASALRFQAADLIPIPIDEAVLDFAVLGTDAADDAEPVTRVLLAAAQEASVMRLVAAVEAAGLPVAAVDLVPLALVRALTRTVPADDAGAEGIVAFGGGVTAIAVHEDGVPRFVRVLGTAGRELTDAIAAELDVPVETAEAVKRQLAGGDADELVARAHAAIERPLAMLLDEVRSSIDYYRNQPGAARLARVVVTGGTSQLPGITDRLGALVGVPVELARPRDALAIGDIGFSPDDHVRLDPYLPAAVGLAIGGAGVGTVVDLLPRARRARVAHRSRALVGGAVAGAALVALLAVPTVLAKGELADKKDDRDGVLARNAALQEGIASKADAQQAVQQLEGLRAQLGTVLANDVSWTRLLQDIGGSMPDDVWLTAFNGTVTVSATGTAAPPAPAPEATASGDEDTTTTTTAAAPVAPVSALGGEVTVEAKGREYPSVAAWLLQLEELPSLADIWVSSASRNDTDGTVTFSSAGNLTDAARSRRLADLRGSDSDGQVTP